MTNHEPQTPLIELSWPGPWRAQTLRYIYSPTELSWPGPWGGQTVIHSFSHWNIVTRATGRTDSEVDSLSHWAILTRPMGRTDSKIDSFSHWDIVTRPMGRTESDSFILPLSHHDWLAYAIGICFSSGGRLKQQNGSTFNSQISWKW